MIPRGRFSEPSGNYVFESGEVIKTLAGSGVRMVGVTGIEPVTPTMSTNGPGRKLRRHMEAAAS